MSEPETHAAKPSPHGAHTASHPTGVHFTPEADIHLLDRVAVLYRYRRVAIAVFVLTAAAMMIQGYTTLKLFQAGAQIMIED